MINALINGLANFVKDHPDAAKEVGHMIIHGIEAAKKNSKR